MKPGTEPSLADLQHDFLQYLRDPGETKITNAVLSTEKVSAELRLKIYANAYLSRLMEALQDNFPALHTLSGDEGFYALAKQYIHQYPSTSFSLRYFGDHLSDLLKQHMPYAEHAAARVAGFMQTWLADGVVCLR